MEYCSEALMQNKNKAIGRLDIPAPNSINGINADLKGCSNFLLIVGFAN